jgi:hypothetical protein
MLQSLPFIATAIFVIVKNIFFSLVKKYFIRALHKRVAVYFCTQLVQFVWPDIDKVFLYFSVNTLMLAKPDKGRQVEAAIIQMAQTGQLGGRLSEEELIGLLERFAGASQQTAVKFDRRRNALDSDDD